MTEELIQGSEEWRLARCGSLGASGLHEALAKTKTGWGAGRANLMASLIVERLTGQPSETYCNASMQWGTETEPQARAAYSFFTGNEVKQVGLIKHPVIEWTHASPDGLVGEDGLIEIKCPNTATHINYLLGCGIDKKYRLQMDWQMICTGRKWCDFVSFDPRLPVELQMKIERVERPAKSECERLEEEVNDFLFETQEKLDHLKQIN